MVLLEPIKRKSRVPADIAAYLKRLILDGKLRLNDQLPSERELAEQLGVSRNSVREALRALELTGLVESRQGGGTFVRAADISVVKEPFTSVLLSQENVIADVLEARKLIEPLMAQQAAQNATDEQIAELQHILLQQERSVAAGTPGVAEDILFHQLVAVTTKNNVLVKLVEAMAELLAVSREGALQTEQRAHTSLDGHYRVLTAIIERNPEAAYSAMRDHLAEVEHAIGALPTSEPVVIAEPR